MGQTRGQDLRVEGDINNNDKTKGLSFSGGQNCQSRSATCHKAIESHIGQG